MSILLYVFFGLLYVGLFGVFVFAFAFADVEAPGPIGSFSRVLMIKVPRAMKSGISAICGKSCLSCAERTFNYVVRERNPILQITYLLIINSAFLGWLVYGAPQLPTFFASRIHVYGGYVGVALAQYSFYLACSEGPGRVTKENLRCYAHQPYDGLLFTSGLYCTTCKVEKPARSKHCAMCGFCVPLFDHHCIWLNQCVGERNFRYFLSFLAVNSAFLFYASYVIFLMLISEVECSGGCGVGLCYCLLVLGFSC